MDQSLDGSTLAGLGWGLRSVRGNDVHFFTLPNAGTGRSADGQSIVKPDDAAVAAMADALKNDDMDAFMKQYNLG